MSARRRQSALEAGVRKAIRSAPAAPEWLAAHALSLVVEIESAGDDAPLAARVSAGKLLRETMADISAAQPKAAAPAGGLDELRSARERRKARA